MNRVLRRYTGLFPNRKLRALHTSVERPRGRRYAAPTARVTAWSERSNSLAIPTVSAITSGPLSAMRYREPIHREVITHKTTAEKS